MTDYTALADSRILLALIGLVWSALVALAGRAISSIEEKIGDNARKITALEARMAAMVGGAMERMEKDLRDLAGETRAEIKKLDHIQTERVTAAERRMIKRLAYLKGRTVRDHEFRLFVTNVHSRLEGIYDHVTNTESRS